MSQRMPMAQKNAVAPAAIVAALGSILPGTYQMMDDAPPAKKARAIKTVLMRTI